jgi:hypothetical protein
MRVTVAVRIEGIVSFLRCCESTSVQGAVGKKLSELRA